jgi:hypothetical protein
MARPTRVDFPGAWYHVLNRGIEKRAIFRSRRCHEKFIELLSSVSNVLVSGSRLRTDGQPYFAAILKRPRIFALRLQVAFAETRVQRLG